MSSLTIILIVFGLCAGGGIAWTLYRLLADQKQLSVAFIALTECIEDRTHVVDDLLEAGPSSTQDPASGERLATASEAVRARLQLARQHRDGSTLGDLATMETDLIRSIQGWLLSAEQQSLAWDDRVKGLLNELAASDLVILEAGRTFNAHVDTYNQHFCGAQRLIGRLFNMVPEVPYGGRRPTTDEQPAAQATSEDKAEN